MSFLVFSVFGGLIREKNLRKKWNEEICEAKIIHRDPIKTIINKRKWHQFSGSINGTNKTAVIENCENEKITKSWQECKCRWKNV